KNSLGGEWNDAANAATNWSTGKVPIPGQDVIIDAAGSYTVTVTAPPNVDIDSLLVQPGSGQVVTLDIKGGIFSTTNISNAVGGSIIVEAAATLQVGGPDNFATVNAIHNTGSITLNGTLLLDAQTAAGVHTGTITLDGGGTVTLAVGSQIIGNGTGG